jgi:hypothetical protein
MNGMLILWQGIPPAQEEAMKAWKVVLVVFWLALPVLASGQEDAKQMLEQIERDRGRKPVAVESLGGGRIQIRRARRTLNVDLAQEISGCTGRLYDRTVNEEYESTVGFQIVDETKKASYTYLLLLASAPPNCNVQGMCGAGGPDSTLIWLKLTEDLALAGKQSFVLDDCRSGRSAVIPRREGAEGEYVEVQAKDLPWIGDALQIEFEEMSQDKIPRLVYDRQNPDAGLQLGTVPP